MTFVVDEVAGEEILVPVLWVSCVSIVQEILHTNFQMSYQDTRASSCKPSNVAMVSGFFFSFIVPPVY